MRYRADIQGLRAVAVVAVVGYHADITGFRGGFVGVDVFFVLSGFLITGLLIGERASSGRVDLRKFYGRRIRRLLPASVVMTFLTVAAGRVVLNALDYQILVTDGFWSLLFSANLRFAADGIDYLAADQTPSALEHYWSLGVEEQFYLFWPIMIVVTGRRLSYVTGGLILASVAAAASASGPWSFYGPHTRIWEFLFGAALAMGWTRVERVGHRMRVAAGLGGTAMLVVAVALIDGQSSWPGPATLLPVFGAVGVLVSPRGAAISRVLSHRVLGWIGDRSYSIYLTQVPVLVFASVMNDGSLGRIRTAVAIGVVIVLAQLLYCLVETPIRKNEWLSTRPVHSTVFGAATVCVGLLSVGVLSAFAPPTGADGDAASVQRSEMPATGQSRVAMLDEAGTVEFVPSDLQPSLGAARDDKPQVYGSGCHLDIATVEPADCVLGAVGSDITWVLVGDSHAAQWAPAWEVLAQAAGAELRPLTKSGCPPMDVDLFSALLDRTYDECRVWARRVIVELEQVEPDVIFVSVAASHRSTVRGSDLEWSAQLQGMLEQLQRSGAQVILISDTPTPDFDVPACLVENLQSATRCVANAADARSARQRADEQRAADSTGTLYLDILDLMCGKDHCPVIFRDLLVYRDASHLTTNFARAQVDDIAVKLAELGVLR